MYKKLDQFNLNDCAAKEDLVQLFEIAFQQWKKNPFDPVDRRGSPRIPADHIKPLFIVSYSCNGKEVEIYKKVPIVDISADGIGMEMEEPVPVGAALCFAFESYAGDRNFGIATVVRLHKKNESDGENARYLVGLTFSENAGKLNVEPTTRIFEPCTAWLWKGFSSWEYVYRLFTRRRHSRRVVNKTFNGKKVRFDIEVKMFRYVVTLSVDGRVVHKQIGSLNDRFRNLYSDDAMTTIISLEAGEYTAWATLRAYKISYMSVQCNTNLPGRSHEVLDLDSHEEEQNTFRSSEPKLLNAAEEAKSNLQSLHSS